MLNNVSLNLRNRFVIDMLPLDIPTRAYPVEYRGGDQRIERNISLFLLQQGEIPIETIEQAVGECIASLQMALPASTNIEPLKSWITANKRLIGRLWIFTKKCHEQDKMIDELRDSYDFRCTEEGRQACVKGTIERLVDTALIGSIQNELGDTPLEYDGLPGT